MFVSMSCFDKGILEVLNTCVNTLVKIILINILVYFLRQIKRGHYQASSYVVLLYCATVLRYGGLLKNLLSTKINQFIKYSINTTISTSLI